jgi:hypothetical protein
MIALSLTGEVLSSETTDYLERPRLAYHPDFRRGLAAGNAAALWLDPVGRPSGAAQSLSSVGRYNNTEPMTVPNGFVLAVGSRLRTAFAPPHPVELVFSSVSDVSVLGGLPTRSMIEASRRCSRSRMSTTATRRWSSAGRASGGRRSDAANRISAQEVSTRSST